MSVRSLARQLGISPTAVSLALQDSPRVSAALRAKVRWLARTAGYVPNARLTELMREVRQSAVPQYRATLGVMSLFPEAEPWRGNSSYQHLGVMLEGARERAAAHGYKLENFWLKAPGMNAGRLAAILEALERYLARRKLRVPRELGLVLLDKNPAPARYAGVCQDPGRIRATTVDLLLGRLL